MDDCPEFLILDTRNCASDAILATINGIEKLGTEQYSRYVKDVLKNRSILIEQPIAKNSLALFKRPFPKKTTKRKEALASIKSDCNLFSHLYIASKFSDGILEDFSLTNTSHGHLPFLSMESCDCQRKSPTYSALLTKVQALIHLHLPFMPKSLMVQQLCILSLLRKSKSLMSTAQKCSYHGSSVCYKTVQGLTLFGTPTKRTVSRNRLEKSVARVLGGK